MHELVGPERGTFFNVELDTLYYKDLILSIYVLDQASNHGALIVAQCDIVWE